MKSSEFQTSNTIQDFDNMLRQVVEIADHQIPGYAYRNNEAANEMAQRLSSILDLCISMHNKIVK